MHFDFPDDFFKEEVMEGFEVSEAMKRFWAHSLQILEVIDDICFRHGIRYFAAWGTLLGAVRHKGFIPWDDDIDLTMLRRDYTLFVKYAAEELPDGWTFVLYHDDPDSFTGIHRVHEIPRVRLSDEELAKTYGCPFAAGVDIFILDDCPETEAEMGGQVALLSLLYGVGARLLKNPCDDEALSMIPEIESITGIPLGNDKALYSNKLYEMMEVVSAMYDDMSVPTSEDARFVRDLAYTIGWGSSPRMPRRAFAKTVLLPFESGYVPAPADYDTVLRAYFGDDYMTPVRSLAGHGYPCYQNQQEKIEAAYPAPEGDELLRKLGMERGVYR